MTDKPTPRPRTQQKADNAPAAEEETSSRYGVLVRGRVYYLNEKVFERGKPLPVTAEEEAHLTKFAVDEVTVEDEYEHQPRQKFRFADTLDGLVVREPTPRARRR